MTSRGGLVVLSLCWAATGAAYLGVSDARRWHPEFVALLSIAACVLTVALAINPRWELAYRLAGTFAIGTLLFRLASVTYGIFLLGDGDAIWVSLSGVATTAMLLVLYAHWWLHEVKSWHRTCRWHGDIR